jgi:hypothetical protein
MHIERSINRRRIRITSDMLEDVLNRAEGNVSGFARTTGLPYLLAYNLVYGRIKSVSADNFRLLFGEDPPYHPSQRIDGARFRGMVRLWLFLFNDVTEKDLYREFFPKRRLKKVDYRIFSGKTKGVVISLEKAMEQKLLDQGLERSEIDEWVEALEEGDRETKVSFKDVEPILNELREVFRISPARILNQSMSRYESGELKMISRKRYNHLVAIKQKAEAAFLSGSRVKMERLQEEICGKRKGMTLFSEIAEQLEFLQKYGRKNPKKYLGRSMSYYRKSELFRIATWRAEKIKADCDQLVRSMSDCPVLSLPRLYAQQSTAELFSSLRWRMIRKMLEDKSRTYEKMILTPSSSEMEAFGQGNQISMSDVPPALGMGKKAFDLMVAENADMFRALVKYDGRWKLPVFYVNGLKEKGGFPIVKNKYEWMAREGANPTRSGETKKTRSGPVSVKRSMARERQAGPGTAYSLPSDEPKRAGDFSTPGFRWSPPWQFPFLAESFCVSYPTLF